MTYFVDTLNGIYLPISDVGPRSSLRVCQLIIIWYHFSCTRCPYKGIMYSFQVQFP